MQPRKTATVRCTSGDCSAFSLVEWVADYGQAHTMSSGMSCLISHIYISGDKILEVNFVGCHNHWCKHYAHSLKSEFRCLFKQENPLNGFMPGSGSLHRALGPLSRQSQRQPGSSRAPVQHRAMPGAHALSAASRSCLSGNVRGAMLDAE